MRTRKKYFLSFLIVLTLCAGPAFGEESKKTIGKAPKTMMEPHTGMEFVWVDGGCYEMGCGDWQIDCQENEKPAHAVCLDGFWIGKYEVTQKQWETILGSNPSDNTKSNNNPVEYVSWEDVQLFIQKLNNLNNDKGFIVRLPYEAEWEYAARSGGKKEIYAGFTNLKAGFWKKFTVGNRTLPVGSSKPNGLGIYDMSSNVFEWCEDWYSDSFYSKSPKQNPTGPKTGKEKVLRSSASQQPVDYMRTTFRYGMKKDFTSYDVGFRLVAELNN
jgi:formylglycine-generating enzyme required for sulfatase activity